MKRLLYNTMLLMLLSMGMLFAQNGAQPAKVPGNVKPVTKVKGARESKPTALPTNIKPVDKSKTTSTKPTVAPMPKTAIKNKQ